MPFNISRVSICRVLPPGSRRLPTVVLTRTFALVLLPGTRLGFSHASIAVLTLFQILVSTADRRLGNTIGHDILDKVDNIRFAEDWNAMPVPDRTKFLQMAYLKKANFDLTLPFTTNSAFLAGGHKIAFTKEKSRLGRITLSRNRLRDLYYHVSVDDACYRLMS